eukprot:1537047-Alexandrium_andersonii.AAC.1
MSVSPYWLGAAISNHFHRTRVVGNILTPFLNVRPVKLRMLLALDLSKHGTWHGGIPSTRVRGRRNVARKWA